MDVNIRVPKKIYEPLHISLIWPHLVLFQEKKGF